MANIDLNEIINRELEAALEPELLQAAVKKQLDGLVGRAVEAAFGRWNAGPGHALTAKIEEALGVQVAAIDLSAATLGLTEIVSAEVGKLLEAKALPVIHERLDGLFRPAPAQAKLEDLIEQFRVWAKSEAWRTDAKAIGLHVRETAGGFVDVNMHPAATRKRGYTHQEEPVEWHECDVQIRLKPAPDGGPLKIWALHLRGSDMRPEDRMRALALTDWEVELYKMFLAGTTFARPVTRAEVYTTEFEDECDCG